jgi:hypothetical protein
MHSYMANDVLLDRYAKDDEHKAKLRHEILHDFYERNQSRN